MCQKFLGRSIIISNCVKSENFELDHFDTIELENIDLTNLNFSCNVLKYFDCLNTENTGIKCNVLKPVGYDVG